MSSTEGAPPSGPPAPQASPLATRRRRRRIPRFLRNGITVVVLILVLEYLVLPKLALVFSRHSLRRLDHVSVLLILLAFALETISLFAYARLTLVVLPPRSLSLSKAWRINLSALTVSHIVPGGTAGGTGLSIRLLRSEGISATDVGFATAIAGIGSAVLLNILLWLALVVSIPLNGFNPAYVTVAIVSVLLLGFFAALIAGFASGEGWAVRVLRRLARRFHFIPEEKLERTLKQIVERLQAAARNPELIRRGLTWAAANWLLDAACLWVCLAALGYPMDPIDLFVAYGVGEVLAAIPVTPGGLGPLEAGVTAVLASFGIPGAIAILAVVGWRFFNFWLPIPVGAGCYMSLRVERGASLRERSKALGAMTDDARHPDTAADPSSAGT
ncbi:MAG: lysylphosphatidylglycerol synthase transmembrane domain-containing protein [Acidimicrobiales bacterium]